MHNFETVDGTLMMNAFIRRLLASQTVVSLNGSADILLFLRKEQRLKTLFSFID